MGRKVLTIDDSKTLRMIVARHLRPFGVEIREAENGQLGVDVARKEKPDLVLLDYNMPVMDGYHTLVELKTDPALKSIPVMMLTTETVKETVMKLIKLGLKDYIAKPFTRETLLQKVNPILNLYSGETPPPESDMPKAGPASYSIPMPANTCVLVLDDKENVLRLVKEYLGGEFNVDTADSGPAAITKIRSSHFDWLLLDLDLPDVSSYRVYEAFKETFKEARRRKRVIGMSLRTSQKEQCDARARGIHEILLKPFTREDVSKLARGTAAGAHEESGAEAGYLGRHGDVRILACPDATDPNFNEFAEELTSDVLAEVANMADEGLRQLVVRLSSSTISGFQTAKRFMTMMGQIQTLGLKVKLVAENDKIREWVAHYQETRDLPVYESVPKALEAFEHASAHPAAT